MSAYSRNLTLQAKNELLYLQLLSVIWGVRGVYQAMIENKDQAAQPQDKRSIFSWCLYDWANSAFSTVIITFVFSVFFMRGMVGDEAHGSALWSYAIGVSGILVAILGPILGAVADHSGARKTWIFWLSMLCVFGSALLWFADPVAGHWNIFFVLACVVIANVGFELSQVFYNAILPHIASSERMGRVSGWAWGMGYLGGLTALAFALFGLIGVADFEPFLPISGQDSANVRATGPLVALWFLAFMLPLLLYTKDIETNPIPFKQAVTSGLKQLKETILSLKHHANLAQYLVASAIYRDGLNTLFAIGGLYAAGVFQMDFAEILIFAIGLNVTAGIGAFLFAHLDDKIGSKPTIMISLLGLIIIGIAILLTTDKDVFIALSLGLGIFIGPAQAAGRTLAGRLSPPAMVTQTFGLYAFTGKSVAFLGPLAYGLATHAYGTQTAGMFTIIMFWTLGLLLMTLVKEKP
jgi:MFS transporter, UMF1 family